MPAGMKWNEFLRNAKNKEELINIIVKFIKSSKGRQLTNSPFIVTVRGKIYGFQDGQDKVNQCNHEEADTRIILLAFQEINDVVVVAEDSDVLVCFYLCGNMLITISNTVGSSNMMPKNMLIYLKSVTIWVKMSANQYFLFMQKQVQTQLYTCFVLAK